MPSTRPSTRPRIPLRLGFGWTCVTWSACWTTLACDEDKRGHLRELLLPREEVRVEGRPPLAGPSELRHAAVDVVEGALHRRRVELAPVDRVGARVRVSELARDDRIVVRDVEVEQVGVRLHRDAGVVEELLRGERGDAGELQRGRGHRGHARDERLRLHDRRVLLVHGRVLRARQRVGEVLPVEQHLGRALVELLLVQRERDRRSGHQHDRRQDDPFPPLDHVQVVAKRGRVASVPPSHWLPPVARRSRLSDWLVPACPIG